MLKTNPRLILTTFLLVALAGTLVLFGSRVFEGENQETGASGWRTENVHVVEIRADGFYPDKIVIKKDDRVIFTTTQGKPFWPASSLHPVHAVYPQFDAQEPIDSDQSWSFIFDRVGEWKYHDHLSPSLLGQITVVDVATGAVSAPDCTNLGELNSQRKRACYRTLLETAFEHKGTTGAFEVIAQLYKTEPEYIEAGCHKQAHEVGDLAYGDYLKHKNLNLVDMPKEALTFCGAGFYHGFLEHYFRDNPSAEFARNFCEYLEERQPRSRITCYHGMGHGLMPDPPDPATWGMPQAALDPVLEQCDSISENVREILECHEGAFNVVLDWMNISQYGFVFNKKDPFAWCREQTTQERRHACYFESGMRIHALANDNIQNIADVFINDIQDNDMASIAMGSAAATVIEAQLDQDSFVPFMRACRDLAERLRDACMSNVAYGVIYHGVPGQEHERALALCASSKLTVEEKKICYGKIASYSSVYWPEQKEQICGAFEKAYQGLCL